MKILNMKQSILMVVAILLLATNAFAGSKDKDGINWMTWDEVQVAMKKEPRKVWVDVYTDWCGWCKVMDKKTFSNPDLIKYMNEHFYAVKFNAELQDDIRFQGTTYGMEGKTNELAVKLMNGQLSYPTIVIMNENFLNPEPLPGYMPLDRMETIMKYLGEGTYKTVGFEEHMKSYQPTWQNPGENIPKG